MDDQETTETKNTTLKQAGKVVSSWSGHWSPYTKNIWVLFYIAIVIVASQVVLLKQPTAGIFVNAAAFIALVVLALLKEQTRQLAISAAILPVATMVTLSIPQTSVFNQTIVFYDTILLLAIIYRLLFTLDQPLHSTRLTAHGYATYLGLMIVIGQALGAIGYVMLRHHYIFSKISLPLICITSIVFAAAEEMFYRGLIQQRGSHAMHAISAAVLTVILYTAATISHTTILVPAFALISGIVLSFVYYKKQNLVLTFTLNAVSKLVYIGLVASFILR